MLVGTSTAAKRFVDDVDGRQSCRERVGSPVGKATPYAKEEFASFSINN